MPTLTRGSFAKPGSSLQFNTGDWRLIRPQNRRREAPCSNACPAGEDPLGYIAKLAQGDLRAAWETLVCANPLAAITGRVCHHPCESACNRGFYDDAIAIHAVERFLGDRAIAEGWNYPVQAPSAEAQEIAVVGAGPAGLSAAYHLTRDHFKVRLFEAEPEPGGLLRTALPPYRLPCAILNDEIARLLAIGIAFEPNRRVGRDLSLDELRASFRAVFLAPGTGRALPWTVDGATPGNLRSGLDLLKEWISIGALPTYQRVAIIGGGNTAIDLARVLKFNGVPEVHLITFQALPGPGISRVEAMSAMPSQIRQALEEGVTIHDRRGVRRLIMRGEAIVGVEMVHMRELETSAGARELAAFEGTETVIKVDQVIPAIGQQVEAAGFASLLGKRAFIPADALGQVPGHPGVFVGGDARATGGSVTGAIGDGRRAAQAIRLYLEGVHPPPGKSQQPIAFTELNVNYFDRAPRAHAPILDPGSRSAAVEIEETIHRSGVDLEARRCFSCGECMACDNCWTLCPDNAVLKSDSVAERRWHYIFDYDHCKGCGLCAHECPVGYIAMAEEA